MSHHHFSTLSFPESGAEVYRMMCEAIKTVQQWDGMTVNIRDHTVEPSSAEQRLARVHRPLCSLSSILLLAFNKKTNTSGNTTLLWPIVLCMFDGEAIWI